MMSEPKWQPFAWWRRLLLWLVFDGPPLGPLAPRLLGLALSRRPRKVKR